MTGSDQGFDGGGGGAGSVPTSPRPALSWGSRGPFSECKQIFRACLPALLGAACQNKLYIMGSGGLGGPAVTKMPGLILNLFIPHD